MSVSEHALRVRRLYKLIFRVHRALPSELRIMGDNYARDEFKRHRTCSPAEAKIFLNEWTDYAINLAKQMRPIQQERTKELGKYLDPKTLDYMTDEQLMQLYELHKAATSDDTDGSSQMGASDDSSSSADTGPSRMNTSTHVGEEFQDQQGHESHPATTGR